MARREGIESNIDGMFQIKGTIEPLLHHNWICLYVGGEAFVG